MYVCMVCRTLGQISFRTCPWHNNVWYPVVSIELWPHLTTHWYLVHYVCTRCYRSFWGEPELISMDMQSTLLHFYDLTSYKSWRAPTSVRVFSRAIIIACILLVSGMCVQSRKKSNSWENVTFWDWTYMWLVTWSQQQSQVIYYLYFL